MASRFFLDTNILVYAHDGSDPAKTVVARQLVAQALAGSGVINAQVIREFCNVFYKKSVIVMKLEDIIRTVDEELSQLLPADPESTSPTEALRLADRYSLSFYDALIIQAASQLQCKLVYSEDMQSGATYGSVQVVNPFL